MDEHFSLDSFLSFIIPFLKKIKYWMNVPLPPPYQGKKKEMKEHMHLSYPTWHLVPDDYLGQSYVA